MKWRLRIRTGGLPPSCFALWRDAATPDRRMDAGPPCRFEQRLRRAGTAQGLAARHGQAVAGDDETTRKYLIFLNEQALSRLTKQPAARIFIINCNEIFKCAKCLPTQTHEVKNFFSMSVLPEPLPVDDFGMI